MMKKSGKTTANADITFLTDDIKSDIKVVEELKSRNIRCIHTFDPCRYERRRQKIGFYMGNAHMKATTLQMFQGLGGKVSCHLYHTSDGAERPALIYAGLTRLKRNVDGS